MLPNPFQDQQFKDTVRITPEQAKRLFASPKEFRVAFSRLTGQQMAVLPNGVKLFTGMELSERENDRRIYWLKGSGPTPGWDVEQVLEALNAGRTGLVMS